MSDTSFRIWLRRDLLRGLGVLGALWGLFFLVHQAFPYVRSGADVIYTTKMKAVRATQLFSSKARARVLVAGNSKTLAAFIPEQFDALSGGSVESFNLGLPNRFQFIDELEFLTQHGQAPTHLVLMYPWSESKQSRLDQLASSMETNRMLSVLFPFRDLARDVALFLTRSRSRGGVRAYYAEGRQHAERMLTNRGYYFIEGQSHYPNDALPDDFTLQRDSVAQRYVRRIDTACPDFVRLSRVLVAYDIRVLFVPAYYRVGEYAPAEVGSDAPRDLLQNPRITVLGPDYWAMPNRNFSDPVHLNPSGAALYTKRLWALLGPVFETAGRHSLGSLAASADRRALP